MRENLKDESLIKNISSELALVALLSRPKLTTHQVAQSSLLIKSIDFDYFRSLLNQHRLWVCVYCNINDHFSTLFPKDLITYLDEQYKKNVAQSHQQFIAYGQLLHLFKTAQIPVRTLKGIPLAKKLYGDIVKRHSKDIDLIIPADKIDLAHTKLTGLGYQCEIYDQLPKQKISLYFKAHKDLTYLSKTGTALELHLRICPFLTDLSQHYTNQLFDTKHTETLSDSELLYLCWHGSHTLYHRLKWLLDIALYLEQLQSDNNPNFESLISLAKQLDLLRALTISWKSANILYETPLPEAINQFYNQDKISQLLTKQSLIALNNPKQIHSITFKFEKYFGEILLPQHWTNKWPALIQKLNPDIIDILMLPAIPAKLSFLHKLLRPLTLCYRLIIGKKYLPGFHQKK